VSLNWQKVVDHINAENEVLHEGAPIRLILAFRRCLELLYKFNFSFLDISKVRVGVSFLEVPK